MTTLLEFRLLEAMCLLALSAQLVRAAAATFLDRVELTEEGLAGLAAHGCERAFCELFDRIEHAQRAFLRLSLAPAVRRRFDLEDIVQDIRIATYRGLANFKPSGEGSLRKYVRGIARHKVVDVLRRFASQRKKEARLDGFARFLATHQRTGDPAGIADRNDFWRVVTAEIDALKPRWKTACRLVLLNGLSYEEAAAHMKLTDGAVRLLVKRACRTLRPRLRQRFA